MRAAAPACSLARALRALAGDLSWERLGRVALLVNASEILPKSLPEASRNLPELTLALLGLLLDLLGVEGFGKKTKRRNLANEEREAREKREPQASQAMENTRREAQTTARRTRAKHQKAQPSQRGESNASIKIASVVGRVPPLLARCARSPGVWSWNVS